jgi:hypothetical protein
MHVEHFVYIRLLFSAANPIPFPPPPPQKRKSYLKNLLCTVQIPYTSFHIRAQYQAFLQIHVNSFMVVTMNLFAVYSNML